MTLTLQFYCMSHVSKLFKNYSNLFSFKNKNLKSIPQSIEGFFPTKFSLIYKKYFVFTVYYILKNNLFPKQTKRVSEISYNEDEFKKAIPLYNEALKNSGYASSLTFQQEQPKRKSRARKRNVIWFNPPHSDRVKTNIGKEFFRLLSKYFPSHHKLRKIYNKNSVKLSYSCMPNVATIISSHN